MQHTPLIDPLLLKQRLHDYSMQRFGRDVFIKCRRKELVFERHNAMYVVRQYTELSLREIGYVCGNGKGYNTSTVLHACNIVENEKAIYRNLREQSIKEWTVELFTYLGEQENLQAPYFELIKRIDKNLSMTDQEWEVWNRIRELVVRNLGK